MSGDKKGRQADGRQAQRGLNTAFQTRWIHSESVEVENPNCKLFAGIK